MFGRDAPTPLPDPVPVARLARTARPRADLQERRDPGAPAGGRGAAPAGPKTASHLAGSGDLRRVDSAPLKAAPMPSPRYRGHPVALASGPPQPPLDQAHPPTRPTVEVTGAAASDRADGGRQPDLGVSPHPRRTPTAWLPAESGIAGGGPSAPWLPVVPDDHVAAHPPSSISVRPDPSLKRECRSRPLGKPRRPAKADGSTPGPVSAGSPVGADLKGGREGGATVAGYPAGVGRSA